MGKPWRELADRVIDTPAASFFLKDALNKSLQRDPVDALADAECLLEICRGRCNEALGKENSEEPCRCDDSNQGRNCRKCSKR